MHLFIHVVSKLCVDRPIGDGEIFQSIQQCRLEDSDVGLRTRVHCLLPYASLSRVKLAVCAFNPSRSFGQFK